MKKIKVERTKKGFPALWECGGGFTNTGEATIITSPSGGPKRAIYIRIKKGMSLVLLMHRIPPPGAVNPGKTKILKGGKIVYKGKCHCCGRSLESAWQDELHIISRPDRTGTVRYYCSECVIFRLSGLYRRFKRREKHEKAMMQKWEKHKYRKSLRERRRNEE